MRHKRYTEGKRGEVIRMILENGFLPLDVLRLYEKKDTVMLQRTVRTMKAESVLSECKTISGIKYVRLTKTGEDIVIGEANAELVNRYTSPRIKDNLRYVGIGKQDRSNKDREVIYKMQQNKIVNDVCARLFSDLCGIERRESIEMVDVTQNETAYFDSATLKSMGGFSATKDSASKQITNSRINGLSVSSGGIYSVYSIGKIVPQWSKTGETKIEAYIRALTSRNIEGVSMSDFFQEAVVLSTLNPAFVRIMQNQYKKGSQRRILMNIDHAYECMYSIPYTNDGIKIFRLMNIAGWQRKIKEQVLTYDEIEESHYVSVACDGYDKATRTYKLIYCIPNMNKLQSFANRAAMKTDVETYQVYCYKSQLPIVVPMVQGYAKVFVIDIEDMIREVSGSEELLPETAVL